MTPTLPTQEDTAIMSAGRDQPWPMILCISKLIEAADILLNNKNYDGTGHELISQARDQAERYLAQFKPEPAAVFISLAKQLWVSGYKAGHNDGISCGHPLAAQCCHDGSKRAEGYEEEIRDIMANPHYSFAKKDNSELCSDEEWINAGCPAVWPPQTLGAELDNCEVCRGSKGGVRGNENRINGIVVCDYCSADGSYRLHNKDVKNENI